MKSRTVFFKKLLMLILCFLCFYFGAKAQSNYRITAELYQNSLDGTTWNNRTLREFSYNNYNIPLDLPSEIALWTYSNGIAVRHNKEFISYQTSPAQPSLSQTFLWNTTSSQYDVPSSKYIYSYGSIGSGSYKTQTTQKYTNGVWENDYHNKTVYDAQGRQTLLEVGRYVNGSPTPMILQTTEFPSYNAINKPETAILTMYDYNTGVFMTAVRANYTYNANGDFQEIIDERKGSATGNFVNEVKSTYTYNATGGKLGVVIGAFWNGSAWVNNQQTDYVYGTSGVFSIVETITQITSPATRFREVRTTNTTQNKLYEYFREDFQNGNWVKQFRYHYVYGLFTTPTQEIQPQIAVIAYPNPTTNELLIKGLKAEKPVKYNIYDMQGRLIVASFVSADMPKIETYFLNNGNYILNFPDSGYAPIKFSKI